MGILFRKNNWYLDYRANGRRIREKVGPSKKLAENAMSKRKVQIAESKFFDIKPERKIRFQGFADTYLKNHAQPNKKSWESDRSILKSLASFFGEMHLNEITPLVVERYKVERRKAVSPATVNRALSCLRCMFNRAIQWDNAKENPVKKVKFFKEDNIRLRFLEKEEIDRLMMQCSMRLQAVITVAINTGMRKGEIANLKWRDVDFQRKVITLLETKNGRKRHIPMNASCCETLKSLQKNPASDYIFFKADGTPYNFRQSFETAMKKAKIEDFRFHDLRHTFASHLVMAGVDLNTVRELLGHRDITMTLRYAHLSPDHKARAVEMLAGKVDTFWTPARKLPEKDIAVRDINTLYLAS